MELNVIDTFNSLSYASFPTMDMDISRETEMKAVS